MTYKPDMLLLHEQPVRVPTTIKYLEVQPRGGPVYRKEEGLEAENCKMYTQCAPTDIICFGNYMKMSNNTEDMAKCHL
jgi:hypothetical protein